MRQLTDKALRRPSKPLCAVSATGAGRDLASACGSNLGRIVSHPRVGQAGCVKVLDTMLQALTDSAIPTTSGVNRGDEGKQDKAVAP